MTAKTYIGKVCIKHPALKGLRNKSTRHCPTCKRDYSLRWREEHPEQHLATKARYRLRMQGGSDEPEVTGRRGLTNVSDALLRRAWVGTISYGGTA